MIHWKVLIEILHAPYCIIPLCWVTFWTHSKIIPVGQFFRRWVKSINQSSVDFYCKPFSRLIDWRKVHFDLIGLLDSCCKICFYGGGGLKGLRHNGIIRYLVWLRRKNPFSGYLEAQLQILSAPNVKFLVVRAQMFKVLAVDGKESARHGGTAHRCGGMGPGCIIPLWDWMPVELQSPIETAHLPPIVGLPVILEFQRLPADYIDHRPHHVRPVTCDSVQQWLRPAFNGRHHYINKLARLIDWLTVSLLDWLIDWLAVSLLDWLIDWLAVSCCDWLIDWLAVLFPDWLIVHWLIVWSRRNLFANLECIQYANPKTWERCLWRVYSPEDGL